VCIVTTRMTTLRRRLIRLGVVAFACYAMYGCALMSFQDRLIFPRDIPGARDLADRVPAGWEQITVKGEDGSMVPAWLHLPRGRGAGEKCPVVMFFHGNAEIIDDIADSPIVGVYDKLGVAVLLVEYRGYGRAGGSPSEAAIAADSVKMYDLLAARPEIDPARIVYYGRSLGGGAACALALERKPAALIMQSCFMSINAMAAKMWLPGFLVRHQFRNDRVVATLDCPILFMHGSKDTIIPCAQGEALSKLAKRGKIVYQACDHNDFPTNAEAYRREIERFLRENGIIE
jgi:pimeloyl-ACP methyl ester carboxylesterase